MSAAAPAVDTAVLMNAAGGDPAAFDMLSQTYLALAPGMHAQLQAALRAQDRAAIANASHALKGCTMLVGAAALSASLQQLESAARGGAALPQLPQLDAQFDAVLDAVARNIGQMGAPQT